MAIGRETTAMGFCSGKETGLNSEYLTGKWEFVAKDQGGSQCVENSYEETSGVRGNSG